MQDVCQLPDNLLVAALSLVSLSHILLDHPPSLHPLALLAHHPSIDAHRTLALSPIPVPAISPAIAAIATHTCLADLSLDGHSLPTDPPAAITAFSSLVHLTALSLGNAALTQETAAALAAALPTLPRLESLDLSDNALRSGTMHALVPGLTQRASLERLDLQRSVCFDDAGYAGIGILSGSVTALRRLTSLLIGAAAALPTNSRGYTLSSHLAALLRQLRGLPLLRELALGFRCCVPKDQAQEMADSLAGLSQLESLRHCVPRHRNDTDDPEIDMAAWTELDDEGPAECVMARAVVTLTRLTELELGIADDVDVSVMQWFSAIGHLSGLRRLTLRSAWEKAPSCSVLELRLALEKLHNLTSLEANMCMGTHTELEPAAALLVAKVAETACALPHLRRLQMPISISPLCELGHSALLKATHLDSLTLDMFLHTRPNWEDNLACLPLIPHATRVNVWVNTCDEWLRPWVSAIAAHSALHALSVHATSAWRLGPLQDVLGAVGGLTRLRRLAVDIESPFGGHLDGGPQPTLLDHVRRLSALTSLHLHETALRGVPAEPQLRTVPVSAAMTGLRRLTLGEYPADAHIAFADVLSRLALRTLVVHHVRYEDVGLVRELLGQLQHLRQLQLHGVGGTEQDEDAGARQLRLAAAELELPGCHDIVVSSSLQQPLL